MSGDHFSLCWNNFHHNLSTGFHSLLQSEDLVDVTLAAEGKYLKAHKIVLSVCSQYFKELFSVNPCKHPIVILKDVSYSALKDLLQFMYQGEVNVSQEELSTFMKVAETLQIKGLTEEAISDTPHTNQNGVRNIQLRDVKSLANPAGPIKRSKPPTKKIVPNKIFKPNVEKPVIDPAPATPPRIDNETPTNVLVEPDVVVEPIKPKLEPPEEPDEIADFSEHSLEIDMSSMVDTSMGESSSMGEQSQSSVCWKSDAKSYISSDANTPGTLQCIIGKRGVPQLRIDGNVFFKKASYKNKTFWYCKFHRTKVKCPAVCWTVGTDIVKWPSGHNHLMPENLDESFNYFNAPVQNDSYEYQN